MTDSNRTEAQAELRKVIADSFTSKTLWTTDWSGMQLQSLLPKPPPVLNGVKRKINDSPSSNKKAKKAQKNQQQHQNYGSSSNSNAYEQDAMNRRAARFQREHDLERQKSMGAENSFKAHHSHLFSSYNSRSTSPFPNADDPEANPLVKDWDRHTIVGTSQQIFKDYLRLTSEPNPETIRPFPVLEKTLIELSRRFKSGQNDYNWICNQFKSLRQDLTVQRIKNEFTAKVYEIHARIALEQNDMVEYNSCQAMLRNLYNDGIPGKIAEFTAYRILMLLHGRNRSDLNIFVGQLTPEQKADDAVKHALNVQRAMSMNNYHAFFQLYKDAPNMGGYIMDHFLKREQMRALLTITKAYKSIPVSFVTKELAFDSDDGRDPVRLTFDFMVEHSVSTFVNPNVPDRDKVLDCKAAHPGLVKVFDEKYKKVAIRGAV